MRNSLSLQIFFLLFSAFSFSSAASAQDKIEGTWFNDEKSAKIEVYKARDSKYYGKIVWLKEPLRDGKPKTERD